MSEKKGGLGATTKRGPARAIPGISHKHRQALARLRDGVGTTKDLALLHKALAFYRAALHAKREGFEVVVGKDGDVFMKKKAPCKLN